MSRRLGHTEKRKEIVRPKRLKPKPPLVDPHCNELRGRAAKHIGRYGTTEPQEAES